jgi:ACS family sodium-dependent inorganic phosphate cotransporter
MAQRWSVRKSMMATLALAWFLSYADRVNMSVASIAMQAEFGWNETTKGVVMASVFVGYMASQMLGGWLVNRVGAARLLAVAVIAFSTLTLLTPLAARQSLAVLVIARVALGVAEGLAVPATYAFIGRWSASHDRSRLLAIVVSGATIGAPVGLMISGFLVEAYGWESAFYLFGTLGLLWAVYWLRNACDNPADHPQIDAQELAILANPESDTSASHSEPIPVKRILSHPAVWAITINKFCSLWMVYVFLAWLPSYFNAVQGVSVSSSGLFAALPWVVMSTMLYVGSAYSDGMLARGRDLDFVRKLMQVLGLAGAMVFLLLVPLADSGLMALVFTCSAMGFLAFCYSGADPTVMEIAPKYSGFITGFVGTVASIPGIVAIPLIGWLVDTTGSYSWGFITAAALNVVGIVVWLLYGTGRKVID